MLFRVWDKKNNCYSKEDLLLDKDGDLWEDAGHCLVIDYKNYEVEFNTGITLTDGTETFYGDIIAIKDDYIIGGAEYLVLTESTVWNMVEDRYYLFEYPHSFRWFVNLVGNIHETELTDAMKVWIKE